MHLILNLVFATAMAAVFASTMSECLWSPEFDEE